MHHNTYFDNGSTSFPKPPEVGEAMHRFMTETAGTYGRAAYDRVYRTSMMVEECRERVAQKLGVSQTAHVCFTANATQAINTLLYGLDLADAEVLVSPLEHNAVMRPLEMLHKRQNTRRRLLPASSDGVVRVEEVSRALSSRTRLVIVNHQSNVNGVIQPVEDIKKALGDVPLLLDVSQSLGSVPVDADAWDVDFVAFTGHKGLLGPTGTGGFFVRRPQEVAPLFGGGTGSNSLSLEMPETLPDRFEAGTPNTMGMAGLLAALENRPRQGWSNNDLLRLINRVQNMEGVRVYAARESHSQGSIFSMAHRSIVPSKIAARLFREYGIEVRSGLHCAPSAHRHLHTFPSGTLRIALSPYHTPDDLDYLAMALDKIITSVEK